LTLLAQKSKIRYTMSRVRDVISLLSAAWRHGRSLFALFLFGLTICPAPGAPDYNLEDDFSLTDNSDESRWSYRYQAHGQPNNRARDGNYNLLPDPVINQFGWDGMRGWNYRTNPAFPEWPAVVQNISGELSISYFFSATPGRIIIHPAPAQIAVVSWLAPSDGRVNILCRFDDADNGGPDDNGISWFIDKGNSIGNLAGGFLERSGSSGLIRLTNILVAAGERLNFVVDPRGDQIPNVYNDATRLFATVFYEGNSTNLLDFDFERDFSLASNSPSSTWSSRYRPNLTNDGPYALLTDPIPAFFQIPYLSGWGKLGGGFGYLPAVLANVGLDVITNSLGLSVFPGQSLLHPNSTQAVVVSWLAPKSGLVSTTFRFSDLDGGGGNGISWFLRKNSDLPYLASGTFDNGGDSGPQRLSLVALNQGERLNFVVNANEDVGYDATRLSARISYLNPLRLTAALEAKGADANLRLAWPASVPASGVVLEAAERVTGPWNPVPASQQITEGPDRVWREATTTGNRFYRLAAQALERFSMPLNGGLNNLPQPARSTPFAFLMDGADSSGWLRSASNSFYAVSGVSGQSIETTTWQGPMNLEITCEATRYEDFPGVEWVFYFRNTGTSDSPLLAEIQALDMICQAHAGSNFILHAAQGSYQTSADYQPLQFDLARRPVVSLSAHGGRSSNKHLPFWNLEDGKSGLIFGVGWSGQWKAKIEQFNAASVRVTAGMDSTHLRLHPGERIRTPRILCLAYTGGWLEGQKVLRRYLAQHVIPTLNGQKMASPIQYSTLADPLYNNETDMVALSTAYGPLGIDYIVMDATWNGLPNMPIYWYSSAGTWIPRADTLPHGLGPVAQAAQNAGLRLGLWFEPERVYPGSLLDTQHPEWLIPISGKGSSLLDFGRPEVQQWTFNMLSNYVSSTPLGYLRHDCNIDPLAFWQRVDPPDRVGVAEIRYTEGLYALMDQLRAQFPGVLFEGCASGGRRIDLEILRRYHTYFASDHILDHEANQAQIYGANLYLPGGYLNMPLSVVGPDPYPLRSLLGSALCLTWDPRTNFNALIASNWVAEFKSLRPLFSGDFYPLLDYTLASDAWIGYQFHREDLNQGMALLFRHQNSPQSFLDIQLRGLSTNLVYELKFRDSGETRILNGQILSQPLRVTITNAPGSVLLTYRLKP
jgi:alpha-galactosidase